MWADQHDLSGFYGGGLGADYLPTLEQAKMNLEYSRTQGDPLDAGSLQVLRAAGISLDPAVSSSTGTATVAIQPTTQDQVFNTINLVAQGILNERIAAQNVKMTQAQAQAATEQAKAAATNYVMQQLQKGEAVLVPKTAVSTPPWAKWGSTALIVGGVALLGYALWKFQKGRAVSRATTASAVPSAPTTTLSSADASMAAANPFRRGRRR
jgi:hypothetical protein